MPTTVESLLKQLPGVGRYTAAAIGSIALGQVGPYTYTYTYGDIHICTTTLSLLYILIVHFTCCLGYWSGGWQCNTCAVSPESHRSRQYKSCRDRGSLVRMNLKTPFKNGEVTKTVFRNPLNVFCVFLCEVLK